MSVGFIACKVYIQNITEVRFPHLVRVLGLLLKVGENNGDNIIILDMLEHSENRDFDEYDQYLGIVFPQTACPEILSALKELTKRVRVREPGCLGVKKNIDGRCYFPPHSPDAAIIRLDRIR